MQVKHSHPLVIAAKITVLNHCVKMISQNLKYLFHLEDDGKSCYANLFIHLPFLSFAHHKKFYLIRSVL